jgi:hypothetical protein
MLTGLADGLALKELRYAAMSGDSPRLLGPPLPSAVRTAGNSAVCTWPTVARTGKTPPLLHETVR